MYRSIVTVPSYAIEGKQQKVKNQFMWTANHGPNSE